MKEGKELPRSPYYRREVTPNIIQMEAVECGAVCLAIILGYFKKFVPLEELRHECGVNRDGSNALNILKAAQHYGMLCEGHRVELDDLYDLPLPLIAFWGFNHYVVIEGFSRDGVYINDPSVGPIKITYEELDENFTGLVLLFEPSIHFKEENQKESFFTVIYNDLKKDALPYTIAFLASLFLVFLQLTIPAFTQIFIDNFLSYRLFSWSKQFIAGMIVIAVLCLIFKWIEEKILSRLYLKLSTYFSARFFWHLLHLPINFFMQRYSGEIAHRNLLNEAVAKNLTTNLTKLIYDALAACIFGVAMFFYDPLIAFVAVAMVSLDLLLMNYLYKIRESAFAYYEQTFAKTRGFTFGLLQSIETVKSSGIEMKMFGKWAGYYTKTMNVLQDISKKDIAAEVLPYFLQNLTLIVVLLFGAYRVINGNLTIGMLLALQILMIFFLAPVTRLVNFNQVAQFLKTNYNRLNDVLNYPAEDEVKKTNVIFNIQGKIEIKNLSFGFNPLADPLLKNINITVSPGNVCAIVGMTGSGKSTLAKLIAGIYTPWSGHIFFDGTDKTIIPKNCLSEALGVAEQEVNLFTGTVKDNISFFNPLIDQKKIIQAAIEACIHEDISAREGGYDLVLINNGSNLSGGQRQRVEIARILCKNANIIILDEATSALDQETEQKIIENIRKRGSTCIIITHRLSSIKNCDTIFVLDKGEIAEEGSHDVLFEKSKLYRELVEKEINL